MSKKYTREQNALIILALLKLHGIKKIVVSPGTTNMALIASMQSDPYFDMYSCVDERSAAYIACGLASESGEPVVISCTGATASRNYLPGITEAYYRKLPILAITSMQPFARVGHLVAQTIDRSVQPKDSYKLSLILPIVKDKEDFWECQIKVNNAILELTRNGRGPVHINLPTTYGKIYDVKDLPEVFKIDRHESVITGPAISHRRVAVFIGSHPRFSEIQTTALEEFCEANNGVVLCDHTSGYHGKFRIQQSLVGSQRDKSAHLKPDLLVHIGEVSGDYYGLHRRGEEVWRVSPDGEIRDSFRKLTHVFATKIEEFFHHYARLGASSSMDYYAACSKSDAEIRARIPEVPFSNIWIAAQIAHHIPAGSVIHFAILNSLRAWNFFTLPPSVFSSSNVGGFGIDGALSTLLGASLAHPQKLFFCIIGDLAFFYDMNALGNRHVGNNMRILVVNNGKGTEFRQFGHHAHHFGEAADAFIAADGHFGNKSPTLIKHFVESLGFSYLSASDKQSFVEQAEIFLSPELANRSIVFEVFTDSEAESYALKEMMQILPAEKQSPASTVKACVKGIMGANRYSALKYLIKGK